MRDWVKENFDGTQSPYAAEAFLEYLYEHNFEIVIESNIWNVIFPTRLLEARRAKDEISEKKGT